METDASSTNMRYNFACTLATFLKDADSSIERLEPLFERISIAMLNHAKADPDLNSVRNDPRFQAMVASAEARLDAASDGAA